MVLVEQEPLSFRWLHLCSSYIFMSNEVDLPTTEVISALLHKLINNTKKYNNIFIVEIIFVVTTLSPAAYNYCFYDDNSKYYLYFHLLTPHNLQVL